MEKILYKMAKRYTDLEKLEKVESETEKGSEVIRFKDGKVKVAHYIDNGETKNLKIYEDKMVAYELILQDKKVVNKQYAYFDKRKIFEGIVSDTGELVQVKTWLLDSLKAELITTGNYWTVKTKTNGTVMTYNNNNPTIINLSTTDENGKVLITRAKVDTYSWEGFVMERPEDPKAENIKWIYVANYVLSDMPKIWKMALEIARDTHNETDLVRKASNVVSFYVHDVNPEVSGGILKMIAQELLKERK